MQHEYKKALAGKNLKGLGKFIIDDLVKSDVIILNGDTIDDIDHEAFARKFSGWWPVARAVLVAAKFFTNDRVDAVIDLIIQVGDSAEWNKSKDDAK